MQEQTITRFMFNFWLFGMTVYAAWHMPDLVIESQSNAIGYASR